LNRSSHAKRSAGALGRHRPARVRRDCAKRRAPTLSIRMAATESAPAPAPAPVAPANEVSRPMPITRVQLEGLVVLKIIKHCQENFPMTVMGQLLGMDMDETLEITNCYPFMTQSANATAGPDALEHSQTFEANQLQYQRDMMLSVREVNIDHQVVGWFYSTGSQMGSFLSAQWLDTQFSYQQSLSNIVCIIYDPVRTEEGTLCLRAYRLTEPFMQVYAKGDFSSLGFSREGCLSSGMIEEVPITLHNSSLINAALVDLEYNDEFTGENDVELSRLSISDRPVLEQSMEFLICDLDTLGKEQSKYAYFVRNLVRNNGPALERIRKRRAENRSRAAAGQEPLPEDDDIAQVFSTELPRLENKVLLKGLDSFVESIKHLASEGIVKQYGVSAIQAQGDE
jgi:translation initiation factor 3 subunit H